MTSPQHSYILDLSTYVARLLRQGLWALIPAAVLMGAAFPWAWNAPVSYEARSTITAYPPAIGNEAEATQQAAVMSDIAAVDLITAQQSPEIVEHVVQDIPDMTIDKVRTATTVKVQGRYGMFISVVGESAERAAEIANSYAEAAAQVLTDSRDTLPAAVKITYRPSLEATAEMALPQSSKLPRLIIAVGAGGLVWLGAAAVLDARAQVKKRRQA